jgi:hypothetical protein
MLNVAIVVDPAYWERLEELSAGRTLRTAGYVVMILTVKPLQRARSKVQLAFGLLVRRAAQARRVVDGIATESGQGFLLCDQGRLGCSRRGAQTDVVAIKVHHRFLAPYSRPQGRRAKFRPRPSDELRSVAP